MIIVAMAIAATALFSPNFSTIVSAIFSADPVLIRAPARIPLVRILRTEDIMEPAPLTIVLTVFASPPPPIRPPISAPRIRLYAGCTFLMIMIIAIIRPTIAPRVVNCASIPFPSFRVKLDVKILYIRAALSRPLVLTYAQSPVRISARAASCLHKPCGTCGSLLCSRAPRPSPVLLRAASVCQPLS